MNCDGKRVTVTIERLVQPDILEGRFSCVLIDENGDLIAEPFYMMPLPRWEKVVTIK